MSADAREGTGSAAKPRRDPGATAIKELPKEKQTLFDGLAKTFNAAIKSTAMYPAQHPMQVEAVRTLKASLDSWARTEGRLDLGFSQNNLLLNGRFVKEGDSTYATVAGYFHRRGLLVVSVARGVSESETGTFLDAVKDSPEAIAEAGGIASRMRGCAHFTIKEIDYSALLSASRRGGVGEEARLWESLCQMGDDIRKGGLTRTKLEALLLKIKDSGKVAAAFNSAFQKPGGQSDAVASIRGVIGILVKEGRRLPSDQARTVRQGLAGIVAKLNPGLFGKLFEPGAAGREIEALQDGVLDALPEDVTADLIVSLIDKEGKVDRGLVSLFERISNKKEKSSAVSTLVAERLLNSSRAKSGGLAEIQQAISEAFENSPRNDFMSQVYQLTVDALPGTIKSRVALSEPLRRLVQEYVTLAEATNTGQEEVRLLLNILWFEKDPLQFRKFSDLMLESLDRSQGDGIRELARDALVLYSEKANEADGDPSVRGEADAALARLGPLAGAQFLVSLIAQADTNQLRGIGRALDGLTSDSAETILAAFRRASTVLVKEKYGTVLSGMKFTPERVETIVKGLEKETDLKARDHMLGVLLRTRDTRVLDELFRILGGGFLIRESQRALVRVCGELRIDEAVPNLNDILSVRPRFDWRGHRTLRVAASVSLGQIGSAEAREALGKYIDDADATVRKAAEQALGPRSTE